MRVACLLAPDLPAAAALRANPELTDRPLVVVSEPGPRATVLSVSPAATRAGIHPGQPLPHARALCADLVVRSPSLALEQAAREALLDVALSVAPRVEAAAPGAGPRAGEAALFADASGVAALFRSEHGLATALVSRAASVGLPAAVAIASSRDLAQLAARRAARSEGPGATRVVEPGGEVDFLAPLPVDCLDAPDAVAEALTRFGLHRIGPLLELPPATVAARLDAELARRLAGLRGAVRELPLPVCTARRLREEVDLETAIDRLEPLTFVLSGMLARLLARLAVRGMGCGELELSLRLGGGSRDERRLGLAAATCDPRVLLRRLRLALEATPPAAPVEAVSLAAEGQPARSDQLDLFRPAGPAPAVLDALLAELEALCGSDRVGAPALADDHRPNAFALVPFPAGRKRTTSGADSPRVDLPPLALRALRPPLTAEVRLDGGRPTWLRSAVTNGEIVRCAGPWRTSGGWWSEEARFAFDSWDVATLDGLVIRLRYDHLRRSWQIDAVYD